MTLMSCWPCCQVLGHIQLLLMRAWGLRVLGLGLRVYAGFGDLALTMGFPTTPLERFEGRGAPSRALRLRA